MTAPPAKPRLESGLLTNNPPDVQRRLDACLNVDPMHFLPGTSGRHIELVQIRLQRLPDPFGALPGFIGLDTGETVAQNGSGRIEHPDNQHHRGQAGGP